MPTTILYKEQPPYLADATPEGGDLWLPVTDLPAATRWELRSEGVCRGDVCMPVPRERESEYVRDGRARFNVGALARSLDQPVVHDDVLGVWVFGEAARARREALESLRAPDFTLPDPGGRPHALADFRGHKVFLVSWASW